LSRFDRAWRRFRAYGPAEGALFACCGVLEALPPDRAGLDVVDLWLDRLVVHLPRVVLEAVLPTREVLLHGALIRLLSCRPEFGLPPTLAERASRVLDTQGHPAARLAAGWFAWRQRILDGDARAQSRLRLLGDGLASMPGVPVWLRMAWHELEALHLCEVLDFAAARPSRVSGNWRRKPPPGPGLPSSPGARPVLPQVPWPFPARQ